MEMERSNYVRSFEDDLEFISSDESDTESLNSEKTTFFVEKTTDDIESDKRKKSELGREVELCSKEKGKLQSAVESLKKEKSKLRSEIELMNREKAIIASEKIKLGTDVELLKEEKDSLHQEKGRLQTDVELLKEAKDSLHQDLREEKDEFVRSAINEVDESIQEFWEAQQELIKQIASQKVTRNMVIGVKENTRGDLVLWNFREKKRATMKETISFQFNRTDKKK